MLPTTRLLACRSSRARGNRPDMVARACRRAAPTDSVRARRIARTAVGSRPARRLDAWKNGCGQLVAARVQAAAATSSSSIVTSSPITTSSGVADRGDGDRAGREGCTAGCSARVPEPDLVICLDAQADVLFHANRRRAQEWLEQRRQQYLAVSDRSSRTSSWSMSTGRSAEVNADVVRRIRTQWRGRCHVKSPPRQFHRSRGDRARSSRSFEVVAGRDRPEPGRSCRAATAGCASVVVLRSGDPMLSSTVMSAAIRLRAGRAGRARGSTTSTSTMRAGARHPGVARRRDVGPSRSRSSTSPSCSRVARNVDTGRPAAAGGQWPKPKLGGSLLRGKEPRHRRRAATSAVGGGDGRAWGMRVLGCVARPGEAIADSLEARGIELSGSRDRVSVPTS